MEILFNKTRMLASCLAFSILAHILFFYALRMFGTYDFTGPINQPQVVVVDLAKLCDTDSPALHPEKRVSSDTDRIREGVKNEKCPVPSRVADTSTSSVEPEQRQSEPEPTDTPVIGAGETGSSTHSSVATSVNSPEESLQPVVTNSTRHPLRTAAEFLATKNEKLTYAISVLGVPVGSAELEAKNENGEIRITLRVKSNAAISSVYPVDDVVETRHIDGQYIMTKIKQQEGSFKSESGFTINLMKKRVSWEDHTRNRSLKMPIPTDEVLDTLSGFYYLRNRQLQIGKTEALHIFDSETYAEVPVEILRREKMRMPNLKKVDTLVVRPFQKTAGIFRRTGDILIWMTDDANKVPVKIVTSIALGKVTAELISAESELSEDGVKENTLAHL